MKPSLKAVLFVCILASTVAASANSIDPGIIIRDPLGCPSGNCVSITGLTFGFNAPAPGFGILHFLNASGVTWNSLIITETGVPAVNVSCSSDVFTCSVVSFGQNGAKIILLATGGLSGIPNGNSFEVLLACKSESCGRWPGGLDFEAVANSSVPEPGTMALAIAGLGTIFARRKLRPRAA